MIYKDMENIEIEEWRVCIAFKKEKWI